MLEFMIETAQAAGDIHLQYFEVLTKDEINFKQRRDLLTKADVEAEKFIVKAISEKFPTDSIYAEEGAPITKNPRRWWFVDPVDGTTSFAHGHPFWCTALALMEDGVVTHGVIWAAYLRELFICERGKVAEFTSGHGKLRKMRVSRTEEVENALMGTGFPYKRNEVSNNNIDTVSTVVLRARDIRRCGAAALDLAYVACGRLDGFWEPYLCSWDVAAGSLMIQEAGGRVTDFAGGDDFVFDETVLATNGKIHDEMLKMMRPLGPEYTRRARPTIATS